MKHFIDNGWIDEKINGKINNTEFCRILLCAFDIRNPEEDQIKPQALAAIFGEIRSKSSNQFKIDFKTGIKHISLYGRSENP